MDVGDWLRSLGLGQYEVAFRHSEIDAEVLPELTDTDLEKLGVPLGHRKRLLKAIAGLSVPAGGSSPSAAAVSGRKADAAERRQLTVMFCDLVGSTAMSARLDPEDMRGIVGVYHRCWANRIGHCGGFVDTWATACSPISPIRKPHLLFAPPLTPPRAATRSCRRALRRRCGRGPRARSPEAAVRRRRDGSRHRAGARTRRPCRP